MPTSFGHRLLLRQRLLQHQLTTLQWHHHRYIDLSEGTDTADEHRHFPPSLDPTSTGLQLDTTDLHSEPWQRQNQPGTDVPVTNDHKPEHYYESHRFDQSSAQTSKQTSTHFFLYSTRNTVHTNTSQPTTTTQRRH